MMFLAESDPRREVWARCESPIEQRLCCVLFTLLGCRAVAGSFDVVRLGEIAELSGETPACFLFSQHRIAGYRADFLAVTVDPKERTWRRLIIECDGKSFHSTDKQIAHDDARDGAISQAGYPTIRYSGSVIHVDIGWVLDELRQWIEAGGVVCDIPQDLQFYASLLAAPKSDAEVRRERQIAREAYVADPADGEDIYWGPCGLTATEFIGDDGSVCRWSDTL